MRTRVICRFEIQCPISSLPPPYTKSLLILFFCGKNAYICSLIAILFPSFVLSPHCLRQSTWTQMKKKSKCHTSKLARGSRERLMTQPKRWQSLKDWLLSNFIIIKAFPSCPSTLVIGRLSFVWLLVPETSKIKKIWKWRKTLESLVPAVKSGNGTNSFCNTCRKFSGFIFLFFYFPF